jgi:hypothetical protein
MLVPSDDPPFAVFRLHGGTSEFPLRQRQGRELIRRLENGGGRQELVSRILAARRSRYPQQFDAEVDDEPMLLAALDAPPELPAGRLAELRDALRERASHP